MCNKDLLGQNEQLGFIDLLSIMSFVISLMNLDENMTQGDKQDLQKDLADKADTLLSEIHAHLKEQDKKLEEIVWTLNTLKNK